jgi:dihydroxy-acid dehydratase
MVGHVCPEAAHGGPLAVVREGETITIDVERRSIDVDVPDDELAARMRDLAPFTPNVTGGVLAKYAALVSSASEGAVTTVR